MVDVINVEVAYVKADEQAILKVQAVPGTTARQVIEQSGILQRFLEIDSTKIAVGIFGKLVALDSQVKTGDRIEIYRPLIADPKEQRRKRAEAGKTMKKRPT